jgi:hypothetical protein
MIFDVEDLVTTKDGGESEQTEQASEAVHHQAHRT